MKRTKQGLYRVIKVTSDNYDGQLFELSAYEELRLQMSTGDYATHKAELEYASSLDNVISALDII